MNVEETKTTNIYHKLTRMQNDLLEINIPKSGKNKFGGFDYYELDDLLPPILRLCKQYECTMFFTFPYDEIAHCYKGILNLISWNDVEDKITVEVPFPQLEKLPKMNWAQSSGTYQTYMKRYLILHTFDIIEAEVIDATEYAEGENNKSQSKPKPNGNSNGKKMNIIKKPAVLQKVVDKCNELHPDKECDAKLLNSVSMKMLREKEISQKERKEIYDYLKRLN